MISFIPFHLEMGKWLLWSTISTTYCKLLFDSKTFENHLLTVFSSFKRFGYEVFLCERNYFLVGPIQKFRKKSLTFMFGEKVEKHLSNWRWSFTGFIIRFQLCQSCWLVVLHLSSEVTSCSQNQQLAECECWFWTSGSFKSKSFLKLKVVLHFSIFKTHLSETTQHHLPQNIV